MHTTQEWDTELEDVSCAHVRRCQFQPSECHSTINYDTPGELLHSMYFNMRSNDYNKTIEEAMKTWFNTNNDLPPNAVDAFTTE